MASKDKEEAPVEVAVEELPPPVLDLGDPKTWNNDSIDAYREKSAKVNAAFAALTKALDAVIGDREPTADEQQGAQLLESARSWFIR